MEKKKAMEWAHRKLELYERRDADIKGHMRKEEEERYPPISHNLMFKIY